MPERLDHPVRFEDPGHLLTALTMLTPGRGPLPVRVFLCEDSRWAIEAAALGTPANIAALARQHGWSVTFPERASGTPFPTAALLAGKWVYSDPLLAAEWAGHTAAPPPDGSWAWLDPTIPRMQFLLGARDDAGAQRILDVLAAHQAQGMRGVPLLLNPTAAAACPFQFFWNVFLERPNPFLFEAADRVWWGPCGHGRTQIFLQYPWSLAVPVEVLHRMPWRQDTGLVLLSRDAPAVCEVGLSPGGDVFAEFPGLIHLERGGSQVHSPVITAQASPQAKFSIEISLGGPDPGVAVRRRIEGLRKEIFAKQQLLEHMVARSTVVPSDDATPDPIFLFAQQAADRGRVPTEIQRLLLEWADQPEDLGAVYYAFLAAENVPSGFFLPGTCVHVVAPATALGRAADFAVGARLLDYAPRTQNSWNLELDTEWAEHRLRLFFPNGEHLWLYPNLRPTDTAAAKLAEAILPEPGTLRDDHLFLLLPGFDGEPHFLLLRKNAFQPLSQAFRWVLDVDAGINLDAAGEELRGRVTKAVHQAIDSNFHIAVQQESTNRLDTATGLLKIRATALAASLDQREVRLGEFDKTSVEYQEVVDKICASLDKVLDDSTVLTGLLDRIEADVHSAKPHIEAIRRTIQKHDELRRSLRELAGKVSEIRQGWETP